MNEIMKFIIENSASGEEAAQRIKRYLDDTETYKQLERDYGTDKEISRYFARREQENGTLPCASYLDDIRAEEQDKNRLYRKQPKVFGKFATGKCINNGKPFKSVKELYEYDKSNVDYDDYAIIEYKKYRSIYIFRSQQWIFMYKEKKEKV